MKAVVLAAASTALLMCGSVLAEEPAAAPNPGTVLVAGQQVKVEGAWVAGVFHAQLVALRDAELVAKIEGAIETASSDRRRLQVLGFDVALDGGTRLYRGSQLSSSRSILTRGAWIEAKGRWRDGVLRATRIRLKEAPEPTEEIEGPIESFDLDTQTVVILNRRVVVNSGAAIVDERTRRATVTPSDDRLRRDDDDGQGRAPLAFGNVILGGRVEAGFLEEQNFTVGDSAAKRTVLSRVQLLASSRVTETVEAYAKATVSRNVGSSAQRDVRLSEAYLLFHEIGRTPITLQLGRQRFRDSREWLFDEYLDALRVHVSLPAVKLEAAVSRGVSSGARDALARRDQLQLIGTATARVRGARLAFHALSRRDDTRGERPLWLSGTVDGRSGTTWSYWTDVAMRRGTAGDTRLAGWAVDAGARHTWSSPWAPTVTAGYAFGSGDDRRGDNLDTRFRQTGLEDNQAYFGGLRRVAVYGELFDPELSNLHVLTAGIGVQPRRGLALDVIYHTYVQATAASSLPSSNLDAALTGAQRALGQEIDVVLTLRAIPGIDIDLASGVFLPGPAFETRTIPAFFWRPQLRFYF